MPRENQGMGCPWILKPNTHSQLPNAQVLRGNYCKKQSA